MRAPAHRAWRWAALARAGLRRMRWHDLRHTYATHLVMANVPLAKVQKFMGHAMLMTMRYAGHAPGNDNDVVGALGGASSVGHTRATVG